MVQHRLMLDYEGFRMTENLARIPTAVRLEYYDVPRPHARLPAREPGSKRPHRRCDQVKSAQLGPNFKSR
jgi:hypothetical protein